jgi:hypothetical protein
VFPWYPLVTFLILKQKELKLRAFTSLLRVHDASQSESSCVVLKELQEDPCKCSGSQRLVTCGSLWKQWAAEENGTVPADVGWRDPENAPQVGAEPGGKLRRDRGWCWLTRVGRSHQEDAYLVQRYGDANEDRKCPVRIHTY